MRKGTVLGAALLALLLSACTGHLTTLREHTGEVRDVTVLPQDLRVFATRAGADAPLLSPEAQAAQGQALLERLFAPWRGDLPGLDAPGYAPPVPDGLRRERPIGYAENLRPWSAARWAALLDNANANAYPSRLDAAITVRPTSVRELPTRSPRFAHPFQPGQGFPFDLFQASTLPAGTPLAITHLSVDEAWVFAENPVASGWIAAEDVARVDVAFMRRYKAGRFAALLRDAAPVRDPGGRFVQMAQVGTLLPLDEPALNEADPAGTALAGASAPVAPARGKRAEKVRASRMAAALRAQALSTPADAPRGESAVVLDAVPRISAPRGAIRVLLPVRMPDGTARLRPVYLPPAAAGPLPLALTPNNLARVGNVMLGQPYGWGGAFGQRDCSAALRDMFSPFGIWLPRNSRQQSEAWDLHELTGPPAARVEQILRQGRPFATLLYLPGHIALYLGQEGGVPLIFHNMWGVRTKDNGRFVVGRGVITSVTPGAELPDAAWVGGMVGRMSGLSVLPGVEGARP